MDYENRWLQEYTTKFKKKKPVYCGNENNKKEVTCFLEIFNDDILRNILDQTNLYASQSCKNKKGPDSPIKNWFDMAREELLAFIGMLIFIGIHELL